MESKDSYSRHQTISRWMGATAVVNFLKRTGEIGMCEENPYFPMARSILLDVTMGEHMIPQEKREAIA